MPPTKVIQLPTWPRLSGAAPSGEPKMWQFNETPNSIEIVPAPTSKGWMLLAFAYAAVMLLGALAVLLLAPNIANPWRLLAFSIVPVIGVAGGCWFVQLFLERERKLGPILIVDWPTGEVRLPRAARSWPIDRVRRLDIVHGRYSIPFGKYDRPHWVVNPRVELQLVIDEEGACSAWPLVGANGRSNVDVVYVANRLAERFGVSVDVVDDDHKAPSAHR